MPPRCVRTVFRGSTLFLSAPCTGRGSLRPTLTPAWSRPLRRRLVATSARRLVVTGVTDTPRYASACGAVPRHLPANGSATFHDAGNLACAPGRVQCLEQFEGLALVFLLGILLGIAAQVDALAQVVERRQVFAPVRVEALQHDVALELVEALGQDRKQSILVGSRPVGALGDRASRFLIGQSSARSGTTSAIRQPARLRRSDSSARSSPPRPPTVPRPSPAT